MIDWQQATQHIAALGIQEGVLLALFPPKPNLLNEGCIYIEIGPSSRWDGSQVEAQLRRKPRFSLGFIQNPGGTRDKQIQFCRSLFFEDDGPGTREEKERQWEVVGLPRPTLQIWTGGKSVHHYWVLDTPCTPAEFRRGQKRLFRHVQQILPEASIDTHLCNPARILRLAGGIHPDTGQMSEVIYTSPQTYSYEQLWNATGDDAYGQGPTVTISATPVSPTSVRAAVPTTREPTGSHHLVLPEWGTPEHKAFQKQQLENDKLHRPEVGSLLDFPRTEQLNLIVEALQWVAFRDAPGSGTYGAAFKLLASMVNNYGVNDALECAARANWSQENWDIVVEAQKIEENSSDRGRSDRVTIFHLFDSAEFNGWQRPWKITKDKRSEVLDPEEEAEERAFHRDSFSKWQQAKDYQFALCDALDNQTAALLKERAEAFPVNEVAMLPPFIASMAAVMGTRYRVRVKRGWEEPMVFWLGTVGPASSMKTPVVNQMLHPLKAADHRDNVEYKRQLKEWRASDREDRGAPPALPRKRVAGDATFEGLCAALENEKNFGMISLHDELVAFIAQMDAYRGRSGPSKDRAQWLSMWSGDGINILRKGADPVFIPETAVSLFGCVQQDKLTELLSGDKATDKSGDGFWSRFLWCVPSNPTPNLNDDESEINEELVALANAFDSFAGNSPVVVGLSPEAWEVFRVWHDHLVTEADTTYAARAAFLFKMRGYAVRLAGFLHALDYAQLIVQQGGGVMNMVPEQIPGAVMERGLRLAQFFINQFDVLAPQVGGNEDLPAWVVRIVELAETREDKVVTAADLRRRKWGSDGKERRQMLKDLVDKYGKGKLVESKRVNQCWWQLA